MQRIHNNLRNHHDSISRSAARLDNLINNLLDVARIDSNYKNLIMLHKEDFDFISKIRDIAFNQLYSKLKDKYININFISETLNESCMVYADRT